MCVAVYLHSLRLCSDQRRGRGKSPAHAPWSRRALRLDPAFPQPVRSRSQYHAKCASSTLLKAIYHVSGRQGSYQLSHRTHYGVRGCTGTCLLALSPARCRTTRGGNTPSNVRMTTTEDSGRCPACRSPVREISGRGNKKLFQRVAFKRQPARELCFHWRDPGFLFSYMEIVIGRLRNHPAITVLFLFGKKWKKKETKPRC